MYDSNMFSGLITLCIVVGVVIGGFIFWLVPWLWSLIKPFLHALTA